MQSNSKNPGNDFSVQADFQSIVTDVIESIASSPTKITPSALEKKIRDRYGLNKKQIKSLIKDLVFSGKLSYVYEFGSTFLERSFAQPVRISKHVVLTPPGCHYRAQPKDIVVQLKHGASFGEGRHPSTRLAIKGIDFMLLGTNIIENSQQSRVLDVGTGSGVLILTAVLGGMDKGLGIDTDPCARVEAAENVKINRLEDRIVISGLALETIDQRFSMVLANLRYPTLTKLYPKLSENTDKKGCLVLSGIKCDEVDDLLAVYAKDNFECLRRLDELGWAGLVFKKH